MLNGIKRWLDDNRDRKEQEHQEADRRRRQVIEAAEEQKRQKSELKEKVVAILEEGKVPDLKLSVSVPFKLQKNEQWLLAADNVFYAEMRTKREIHGRSTGASFRVMKGMSIRTGASRGTPVETDELTSRGRGVFAISTKHVFFNGERSFRIALNKIVSAQGIPSMGLEIVRDRASAQPEYFGMDDEDAEFMARLIHLLPDVDFGKGQPQIQPIETYLLSFGDMGADDLLDDN